eukprot:gene20955-12666_t
MRAHSTWTQRQPAALPTGIVALTVDRRRGVRLRAGVTVLIMMMTRDVEGGHAGHGGGRGARRRGGPGRGPVDEV